MVSTILPGNAARRLRMIAFLPTIIIVIVLMIPVDLSGRVVMLDENDVKLIWTAPGDDHNQGQASYYDIRFSSTPIPYDTAAWWRTANRIQLIPKPSPAGQEDSCIITDLPYRSYYYFAIRTADEVLNWSGVSNIAELNGSICGDVNGDGTLDSYDVDYLLAFLFGEGPPPVIFGSGDVDNSGELNVADAYYIINFMFNSGPPPNCEN